MIHDLSWADVAIGTGLLLLALVVSLVLRLGLERDLAIGMARTLGQLTAAGFVLTLLFRWDVPVLVLLAMAVMLLAAAWTAFRRISGQLPGAFRLVLLALSGGALLTLLIVAYGIVNVTPWYSPRYLVPIFGMILGNAMTGVALALERLVAEVSRRRDEIELLLSLGANAWQALREPVRASLKAAMIPTINSLMVVGIVFLPGMMTGQILAGVDPMLGIRYQIVVVFMVTFAVTASCLAALLVSFRRFFNEALQLRELPGAGR